MNGKANLGLNILSLIGLGILVIMIRMNAGDIDTLRQNHTDDKDKVNEDLMQVKLDVNDFQNKLDYLIALQEKELGERRVEEVKEENEYEKKIDTVYIHVPLPDTTVKDTTP